ncbi:MAG: hypothetical protein MUF72_00485 [Elainella sp. Prado103]|jgi:hypothetical protein|nr:hypothetical protein [Elainella sp. Prado103]
MQYPFSVQQFLTSVSGSARWLLLLGVSSLTIGTTLLPAAPTAIAQVDPNTGFSGIQIPSTSISPVNGAVRIHFINETGSAIDYQVIDDTEYRFLPGRSQMTLEGLRLPTTFTFRRADNGFLRVTLYPNSPEPGDLTMRVRETPSFAEDRTTIYVDERGKVFLN